MNFKNNLIILLLISMMSCSNEAPFDKDYAFSQIQDCNTKHPRNLTYGFIKGGRMFNDELGTKSLDALKRLKDNGVIALTTSPGPQRPLKGVKVNTTDFEVKIKDAYKQYLFKDNPNNATAYIVMINLIEVTNVEAENSNQVNVTVKYKIVKTPFFNELNNSLKNSWLKDKPDVFTEVVKFYKNNNAEWVSCD